MNENTEYVRHSLAHLLAASVLELYPNAQPTIGPAIENGFYYDFDNLKLTESDLSKLESKMKELLPSWTTFSGEGVSAEDAREHFKNNPYKRELIDELEKEGQAITLYTSGGFTDLCRGGHVENPAQDIRPDAFSLSHIAGAYWRGDENNPMLTRIYGLAFATKEELENYKKQQEEARERDHRKLGKELDLFTFSELVGSGLPLWTPRGALMRELLDDFVWQLRHERGYEKIEIPHITKKALYETSGHWDKFGDELFKVSTREGHEFILKPMNCPHHTQIFARKQHSYRDMPVRYANTTMVYRDEQTGELAGLTRVRSITQDDAHVFCRYSQIQEEFEKIWDIVDVFYSAFGFSLTPRLSLHDPSHMENYLGDEAVWQKAADEIRAIAQKRGVILTEALGEASFYGPKLDFVATDSLGREWQIATIQLDMNMPERFDLSCINEKGERERVAMIHAAIMGSLERFIGILIEHTAGNFPLWLSPMQIMVLPIAEGHRAFAEQITTALQDADIRVHLDNSDETLGKKIRDWKVVKAPYALVIGDKEIETKKLKVENRDGEAEILSIDELIAKLTEQIRSRQ